MKTDYGTDTEQCGRDGWTTRTRSSTRMLCSSPTCFCNMTDKQIGRRLSLAGE